MTVLLGSDSDSGIIPAKCVSFFDWGLCRTNSIKVIWRLSSYNILVEEDIRCSSEHNHLTARELAG